MPVSRTSCLLGCGFESSQACEGWWRSSRVLFGLRSARNVEETWASRSVENFQLVGTVGQLSDFEKPQAVCSPVKRKYIELRL